MGEREHAGSRVLWCFIGKWVGGTKLGTCLRDLDLGNFALLRPNFFFSASGLAQKKGSRLHSHFFWGGFYGLFFPTFFLTQGDFSGGVFGS